MLLDAGAVARAGLAWAQERDYTGWDKSDALNSPLLRALSFNSKLLRAGWMVALARSPVNLRPLLGVVRRPNPKSLAVFARAHLILDALDGGENDRAQADALLDQLLELSQHERFAGHCWGAHHPRQTTKFFQPAHSPGGVVTAEVGHAFLDAYAVSGDEARLEVARSAARFLLQDLLRIVDEPEALCLSYVPDSRWQVINANAMTGGFLARLAAATDDDAFAEAATRNLSWLAGLQTPEGAWYYAEPPSASHVAHDNYHTAFVLGGLLHAMESLDEGRWRPTWRKGLDFYRQHLFLDDGTPRWRSDRTFPADIKGACHGVMTFAHAHRFVPGSLGFARTVARWILDHLWHPTGRFHYQQGRLLTKRYTLMRWCQSWACYAFATLARAEREHGEEHGPLA